MNEFPARAGSIPIVWHGTVGSTNEEALALAASGERGPLFIATETQSAGRGRRGREWMSQPGNLHATLLIADPAPPSLSPQLCFVAALALHDAVLDSCPGLAPTRLKLKWPNDLLLDGKKMAGILVEGTAIGAKKIAVAVGFGVNCKHHPGETQFPAADFAAGGVRSFAYGVARSSRYAMGRSCVRMESRRRLCRNARCMADARERYWGKN